MYVLKSCYRQFAIGWGRSDHLSDFFSVIQSYYWNLRSISQSLNSWASACCRRRTIEHHSSGFCDVRPRRERGRWRPHIESIELKVSPLIKWLQHSQISIYWVILHTRTLPTRSPSLRRRVLSLPRSQIEFSISRQFGNFHSRRLYPRRMALVMLRHRWWRPLPVFFFSIK